MRTQVKICGVTRAGDVELALSEGARYIGINAYPKSPRCVPDERLHELLEIVPSGKAVVVDVAPDEERVRQFKDLGFDRFQFHFDLTIPMSVLSAWCNLLGPEALWLAPRIPDSIPVFPQILMEFTETILLDTYSKHAYGGTGISGQNWQRFLDCTMLYQHKRWILAGGLNPENVQEALQFTRAETIDVASGIEREPGMKDPGKLELLFSKVREWEQQSDSL